MARSRKTRPASDEQATPSEQPPNPAWFKPVMFGFMLIGLAWIIVYYISQGRFPVEALGAWNIVVGFGIAFVGFIMSTRWR